MKHKRASVKNRIIKHVVVAVVLTIVFMTVINLIYLSRRIIEQQQTKLELATGMTAQTVDAWLGDMATVTEDMASTLTAIADLNVLIELP